MPVEVAAAVIERDGKILITRRGPGGDMAGKWEFPGGKLEPGETAAECLRREIWEELRLRIEVGEFIAKSIFRQPGREIVLLAYWARWLSGEPVLTVHDEFQWITLPELANFDFAPADIPVVAALLRKVAE